MDIGTVSSVFQTLFAALQSKELREVCSILGYKSELGRLGRSVNRVKAVLEQAESKQVHAELPPHFQRYVDQLKDAVYEADDLLDEFVTLAQSKKLIKGGQISEKVRLLLSSFNPLTTAHRMSRGVKDIRKKLDNIANDRTKFGSKLGSKPILKRREETCSYVYEQQIIGRDDDVDKIMHMLLDADVKQDVSYLTIVGIGGLGKTALTQLVYNHPRIKENFPLRVWTCVADQDVKGLDVEDTLRKILHSATSQKHDHLLMEHVQTQLQEKLAGKKYFFVLDDVWNEDRYQWLKLMEFLRGGLKGSWVLVTTRSRLTATVVGGEVHELNGLSDDNSWLLFEKTAFGDDHEQTTRVELDQIGREIVKQCANVPLAIKVVGTALYGQDKRKWLSFQELGLGRTKEAADQIKPILRLSYLNLEPQLKMCFSYCALFPKDFIIGKASLIYLWIAQGYVVPSDEGPTVEDVAEDYFLILVRRCFFQDVVKDERGEIIRCKMHDLMHDVAQEVAGKEIPQAGFMPSSSNDAIRHLFHLGQGQGTASLFTGGKIRTYLGVGKSGPESSKAFGALLNNWKSLRALDLRWSGMTELPSTLGNLLHLRYLDLSENYQLEMLPNSITKLHNLQFLFLAFCERLKEFPEKFGKLTNLRVVDTTACMALAYMPRGIGRLSSLWKLPFFVLGEGTSSKKGGQLADQVEEIKALNNLRGKLHIQINIPANANYGMENGKKEGCLSQHLNEISIKFPESKVEDICPRVYESDEALLEDLRPHPNLKVLLLERYCGERMPNWARDDNLAIFLSNLVAIVLLNCHKLKHVGVVGKLPKLKSLTIDGRYRPGSADCPSSDLEYIENTTMSGSCSGVRAFGSEDSFFASLENLVLRNLPKLKGWWSGDHGSDQEDGRSLPAFPCLSHLAIIGCPNLVSMPLCPAVEYVKIWDCNVDLRIMKSIEPGNSKLRTATTGNMAHLRAVLPVEAFQGIKELSIKGDQKLEKLSEFEGVFRCCSSSLQQLEIEGCALKSVTGGVEHLTALEILVLACLPSLSEVGEGGEDDGMPWRYLHSLRSLSMICLPNIVKLPNGMRYLTALQTLAINDLRELESLPDWMLELASLENLDIRCCSTTLKERCRKGTGQDWPKIEHIPNIYMD